MKFECVYSTSEVMRLIIVVVQIVPKPVRSQSYSIIENNSSIILGVFIVILIFELPLIPLPTNLFGGGAAGEGSFLKFYS